jgi:hypothetical protein
MWTVNEKYLGGSGRGLFDANIPAFTWRVGGIPGYRSDEIVDLRAEIRTRGVPI